MDLQNFKPSFLGTRQGSPDYSIPYKHVKQEASNRLDEALNTYKREARRWGKIHQILGLSALASSLLSAMFTLSSNQALTFSLSLLSAILAGTITFLNPSSIERKYQDAIADCLNFRDEVIFSELFLNDKSISEVEKYKKIEDLYSRLKTLNQALSKLT